MRDGVFDTISLVVTSLPPDPGLGDVHGDQGVEKRAFASLLHALGRCQTGLNKVLHGKRSGGGWGRVR